MKTKHRQLFYILLAFLILSIGTITGMIANEYLQSKALQRFLDSGFLVINWTGITIGLYNIYQGLTLKSHTKLWIYIFMVGVICVFINAYALGA